MEHVVLTTHAYEHKLFVAPFARKFPGCQVRLVTALHSDWYPAMSITSCCHCDSNWRLPLCAGVDEPGAVELPREPACSGKRLHTLADSNRRRCRAVNVVKRSRQQQAQVRCCRRCKAQRWTQGAARCFLWCCERAGLRGVSRRHAAPRGDVPLVRGPGLPDLQGPCCQRWVQILNPQPSCHTRPTCLARCSSHGKSSVGVLQMVGLMAVVGFVHIRKPAVRHDADQPRKGSESGCWRVAAKFENVGSLTEVAMFHRSSRTLLLTDAVVFVPQDAPEIVPLPQLSTAGALPWYACG